MACSAAGRYALHPRREKDGSRIDAGPRARAACTAVQPATCKDGISLSHSHLRGVAGLGLHWKAAGGKEDTITELIREAADARTDASPQHS